MKNFKTFFRLHYSTVVFKNHFFQQFSLKKIDVLNNILFGNDYINYFVVSVASVFKIGIIINKGQDFHRFDKNWKKWILQSSSGFVLFTFCCYFRLKIKGQRLLIWWRFHPFLASVRQSLSFITSFLSVFLPCLTLFSFLPSCVPNGFWSDKAKVFRIAATPL